MEATGHMNLTIAWFQASTTAQGADSPDSWLQWVPIFALVVSALTFGSILFFRWRDSRTYLKIVYSVGEPEYLPDVNDIPVSDQPREPALWIKVFNQGKMDVRLNNVYIEISRGNITFEGLGGLQMGDSPTILQQKPPGGHWIFYQRMFNLGDTLKKHGCGGTTRFKLVVRDWHGRLHKKTVKIEDLEHWATLYGTQLEVQRPHQSWWQKRFGRC